MFKYKIKSYTEDIAMLLTQSTNLSKISTFKKATKIGLFGIFGAGDIGKTWKCNDCGSKF